MFSSRFKNQDKVDQKSFSRPTSSNDVMSKVSNEMDLAPADAKNDPASSKPKCSVTAVTVTKIPSSSKTSLTERDSCDKLEKGENESIFTPLPLQKKGVIVDQKGVERTVEVTLNNGDINIKSCRTKSGGKKGERRSSEDALTQNKGDLLLSGHHLRPTDSDISNVTEPLTEKRTVEKTPKSRRMSKSPGQGQRKKSSGMGKRKSRSPTLPYWQRGATSRSRDRETSRQPVPTVEVIPRSEGSRSKDKSLKDKSPYACNIVEIPAERSKGSKKRTRPVTVPVTFKNFALIKHQIGVRNQEDEEKGKDGQQDKKKRIKAKNAFEAFMRNETLQHSVPIPLKMWPNFNSQDKATVEESQSHLLKLIESGVLTFDDPNPSHSSFQEDWIDNQYLEWLINNKRYDEAMKIFPPQTTMQTQTSVASIVSKYDASNNNPSDPIESRFRDADAATSFRSLRFSDHDKLHLEQSSKQGSESDVEHQELDLCSISGGSLCDSKISKKANKQGQRHSRLSVVRERVRDPRCVFIILVAILFLALLGMVISIGMALYFANSRNDRTNATTTP